MNNIIVDLIIVFILTGFCIPCFIDLILPVIKLISFLFVLCLIALLISNTKSNTLTKTPIHIYSTTYMGNNVYRVIADNGTHYMKCTNADDCRYVDSRGK